MIKLIFKLFKKSYTNHLDKKVEKYYKIYNFSMEPNHTSHNNEADAFKHTYMSAELTIFLGVDFANKIGLLQEETNSRNVDAERAMDLFNNEVGRKIGLRLKSNPKILINTDDKIAEEVMKAMRNNELITNINGEAS